MKAGAVEAGVVEADVVEDIGIRNFHIKYMFPLLVNCTRFG